MDSAPVLRPETVCIALHGKDAGLTTELSLLICSLANSLTVIFFDFLTVMGYAFSHPVTRGSLGLAYCNWAAALYSCIKRLWWFRLPGLFYWRNGMEKDPVAVSLEQAFYRHFNLNCGFQEFLQLTGSKDSDKRSFKQRVVYEPKPQLKFFLRFLNQYVFSYANVLEDVVHSYRPGTSPKSCLLKHADSKVFYKADLKSFFESISQQDVNRVFEENLAGCPIHDISDYKDPIMAMVMVDEQLPIGFPTSPLISNAALFQFDKMLLQWADKHEVVYTRYADDLVFSALDIKQLKEAPDVISGVLESCFSDRLRLNLSKSYFIPEGQKAKILGLIVLPNGRITITRELKNKIEVLFYFYKIDHDRYLSLLGTFFKGSSSGFMSTLSWVASVDPLYMDKLRCKRY